MTAARRKLAVGTGSLILLVVLLYLPSLSAGFIWDDDVMLTNNPLVKAARGLYDIWFSTTLPDYFPLTSTTFWLEWRLWGMRPFGYHLTNVLLHALGAVLLWRVLARLAVPGAWVAALVWAIHPVCVASVAWIAERKNTLSMVFFWLSILWYLRSEDRAPAVAGPQPAARGSPARWYWLSLLAFLLALLSKTSVVALPLVLWLCAWWRHGNLSRRDLWRSAPFFVLALVLGLVTVWFQTYRGLGTGMISSADPRLVRVLGGTWAVWHYLFKALLPLNLMMIYPRWTIDPRSLLTYLPALVGFGLAGLFWVYRRSWGRPLLFALGYHVVTLAPVLGFFDMGFLAYSRAADHWQYLALAGGVALVIGGGAHWLRRRFKGFPDSVADGGGEWLIILAVLLAVLTWRHQAVFASSERLWRETLARNPTAWVAHNSLGLILAGQGKLTEAVEHYTEALRLNPSDPASHYNFANALVEQGKLDEAAAHYRESLRLKPSNPGPHHNLAIVLNLQGKYAEAAALCREALKLSPRDANIADTLGIVLFNDGKLSEAEQYCSAALAMDPHHANARDHLGRLLARKGDLTNAILQFQAALQIQPDHAAARLDLGKALSAIGQFDQAAEHYGTALQLQPAFAEAHYNWAILCLLQRQPNEALAHYREALRLWPDYADALNNLAWLLATSPEPKIRDGREAVRLAEKACELAGRKQARFLGTLDAAYAESGRFAEAIATAKKAREQALAAGEKDLAAAALQRQHEYEAGRPFREIVP
ncbi:MAG: tetratricopeptide repeat protein [Verrucomicrobia bacterium]|jgi:tetratricopeptide (TPR) repeat protein|nr:tetratricopeptide repeat protein [Verrucomicrobiota bacterium]OQC23771.1 MAG: TPR repeat-containing protein YrrB [Verrucomicrobia bacterium ADurb.Bin063]MDI9373310.1 tetratricopeptide repeat protein [Verrucomicrobiota bacterium]HNW08922.1 tetratricopeptide repeat protein [Verrucomicrobiota bacterium]HNZ77034.1 tetratricopeptide repeat protein [Verrucomicrobiota bacterium]